MELAGQLSGTACLVGQPENMINFICKKISDYIELTQPALTIYIITI